MFNYRFKEWKDYILHKNELEKKHDTIVLLLDYNQLEKVKKTTDFFYRQKNIDILFVDNHSTDGSFEFLMENYKNQFNLIQTSKNIGGAGGYALGQEWLMEKDYDYCIFAEDDAIPLDEDIIEEMLKYKSPDTEIYSKFFEANRTGYFFHFHLIPVWIFKEIGVVNKDFFIRADDGEYFLRIEKFLKKKKKLQTLIIDKRYSHPLIKKTSGRCLYYFDLRNWIITYFNYPSFKNLKEAFIVFIKHTWNAFFILFFDRKTEALIQTKDALIDAFKENFSRNEEVLKKYLTFKIEPKNFKIEKLILEQFINNFKQYRLIEGLNNSFLKSYFGKSYSYFISGPYNNNSRILAFLGKEIVFIEEFDFLNKKIIFFKYKSNRALSFLFFLLSFLISLLISFFLMIFFGIKFFIINLKKTNLKFYERK